MNNLMWTRMFLLIVALFVPIYADVLYNETNVHVFPAGIRKAEEIILASLQTTKNFFAESYVEAASLIGLAVATYVPTFAPIAGMVFVLRSLLAEESDWREAFSKTIAREIRREITLSNLRWVEATMETIEEKFQLMNESNPDMHNRKTVASFIHTDINIILNLFAHTDSLFKKYPLLSTPPLTALALLILVFHPIAKELIPLEANSPQLACKMIKVIEDLRPRAVHARLEKLSLFSTTVSEKILLSFQWRLSGGIFDAMQKPYDQYGYNDTIPGTIDCVNIRNGFRDHDITVLMQDDFGADAYFGEPSCINDYALFVRHRVEEMFPVELLDGLCPNPLKRTGFGWLTIKLLDLQAHGTSDSVHCEFTTSNECDPFVKVFIDNKLVLETPYRTNECCYDVDETIISNRITKESWIKIEVWDADYFGYANLVLRTEGNVESFLRDGHRPGVFFLGNQNHINTNSFWQDEYEKNKESYTDASDYRID